MSEVTRILSVIEQGDSSASEQLLPLVYEELRRLAAATLSRETPGHTLQPTALVHEAYVRLVDVPQAQEWGGRGHFFAAAAEAMRRILVESARRKGRIKHGGQLRREPLDEGRLANPTLDDETLLSVSDALDQLVAVDAQAAETVKLHFFAGLTLDETASVLGVSVRTVHRNWAFARAWLFRQLGGAGA